MLLFLVLVYIYNQRDNFLIHAYYFDGSAQTYIDANRIKQERKTILEDPASYTDEEHFRAKAHPESKVMLRDGDIVSQYFLAAEGRIEQVSVYLYNPEGYTVTGTLHVSLLDENAEEVADTQLAISKVANAFPTIFSFTGKTEKLNANETATTAEVVKTDYTYGVPLKKGHYYELRVEVEGLSAEDELGIYVMDEAYADENEMQIAGQALPKTHMFVGITYRSFSVSVFLVFCLGILLAVIFVWIPWDALSNAVNRRLLKRSAWRFDFQSIVLWLLFLLTPYYNFFILMKISGMYNKEALWLTLSFRGLLNLMIIGAMWWALYVIFNRKKAAILFVTTICTVFGFVNYALLQFRDSPLIATDIANVGTAMQVTSTYRLEITKAALWVIMLYAIWAATVLSLKERRHARFRGRILNLLIGVFWITFAWHVMFKSSVIQDHHIKISSFNPRWNYRKNGYMLSFWVSVGMSYVEKPAGYAPQKVKAITDEYVSDEAVKSDGVTEQSPNILVIMNESFSDLQANGTFATNQPYLPFFNSLTENTIKGTAHSSVYGGTTADSEFEFLTGFSMKYLPFHSVPYTNLIKSALPSLTYDLKDIGYAGNIAFHPGMENSYNRNNAYPLLGFDEHISVETMKDPQRLRAYVSDESDYAQVMQSYEEHLASKDAGQPFYMYNVTIQNHGSYSLDNGVVDAGISIEEDTLQDLQAINYLNLIKKSDEALEELIHYFEQVKEPTVIVLYGDHQPKMESTFFTALRSQNGETKLSNLEKSERKYRIPFMIWANFDIPEETGVEISLNYLASYMKQVLNMPMTGFDKYLLELFKTLPVITDIAVVDNEGNMFEADGKTPYDDLLLTYQQIQYNGFMDAENRIDEFFYLSGSEAK